MFPPIQKPTAQSDDDGMLHIHRCKHSRERSSHLINENALWALSAVGRGGGVSRGGAGRWRRWGTRGQRAHLNRPILRARQTVKLQELIGDPVHHQQSGAVLHLHDPLHNLRDTQNLTLTKTYRKVLLPCDFGTWYSIHFANKNKVYWNETFFGGNAKFIGERKPYAHKHNVYWGNAKILWTNSNSEHKSFACNPSLFGELKTFANEQKVYRMRFKVLRMNE